MGKRIRAQDDRLSEMLKALQKKEEGYFIMFARMEAAIEKSNAQMEALWGMMGTGM
jgi:flagellar capping protein FliD